MEKIDLIIDILKNKYPQAQCALVYNNPVQLLIAARLSAQCMDSRVNIVTAELFKKFQTVYDFAAANIEEIERIIYSCGLYKKKACDIVNLCRMIIDDYDGILPNKIETLVNLPGVGRKTANLIIGEIFNQPAIVVDTHFARVTKRLGFHKLKNPVKIEKIMKNIVPENESIKFCHRIVFFGREICRARNSKCKFCEMKYLCGYELRLRY